MKTLWHFLSIIIPQSSYLQIKKNLINEKTKLWSKTVKFEKNIKKINKYLIWLIVLKNTSCKNVHLFWEKDFSNIFPRVCSPFHKNSLTIILRQFLSPFHKDYLKTNFNLTTKITLTIKNSSLGVLDTTLCDKVFLRQVNGFLRVLQFSPRIKLTDILVYCKVETPYLHTVVNKWNMIPIQFFQL